MRTGLGSGVLFPDSPGGLQPSEITIPEMLKSRGYVSKAIGEWHLGVLPQYLPTSQGFDSYFGIPYSNDMDMVADGDVPGGIPGGRFGGYMNPKVEYFRVPLMRDQQIVERPRIRRRSRSGTRTRRSKHARRLYQRQRAVVAVSGARRIGRIVARRQGQHMGRRHARAARWR